MRSNSGEGNDCIEASDPSDFARLKNSGGSNESIEEVFAQYVDRIVQGDTLDLEDLKRRHPEMATELIDALRTMVGGNDDLSSSTIGEYTIVREIGRGGMGVVYEAWHSSLERPAAVKLLPAGITADPKAVARFIREAQIAGKLRHPNIVAVYGMGFERQTPYYAMEYVDGETLRQVLKRRRRPTSLPASEAEREAQSEPVDQEIGLQYCLYVAVAFADIADGLQHAHSQGIVHRDIKPSNLILEGQDGFSEGTNRLRILDFGLARLEGSSSLTVTGDIIGTLFYMSPEQAANRRQSAIDHRSDIYSFGASLYEALTLQPPFQGQNNQDTLSRIIAEDPQPVRRLNPRVPKDLETIVAKCMRKAPSDRYQSAEAVAQDLRRFVRGDVIEARQQTGLERLIRKVWRRRWRFATAAMILVLAGISCGLAWRAHVTEQVADFRRREAAYAPQVQSAIRKIRLAQLGGRESTRHELGIYPWGYSLFPFEGSGRTVARRPSDAKSIRSALDDLEMAVDLMPMRSDAQWHRARAYLIIGDELSALRDLQFVVQAKPNHLPAQLLLASLQSSPGEVDLAQATGDRPPESATEDWERHWWNAQRASQRHDWLTAADEFRRVAQTAPKHVENGGFYIDFGLEIALASGVTLLKAQRYDEALQVLTIVSQEYPQDKTIQLLEGAAILGLGNEPRAFRILDEVYRSHSYPDEIAVAVFSIIVDYFAGDNAAILDALLHWVDRIESQSVQENFRGFAYWTVGMRREALIAAKRSVEIEPTNANRHWTHSYFAVNSQTIVSMSEAIDAIRDGLAVDPENAVWNARLAECLFVSGKSEEAEAQLSRAAKLANGNPHALRYLTLAYEASGRLKEALRCIERAADLRRDRSIYTEWGDVLFKLGRFDEAISKYDTAIRIAPKFAPPYFGKAKAIQIKTENAIARGDIQEAEHLAVHVAENYTLAIQGHHTRTEMYAGFGRFLEERGEFVQAFNVCVSALALDSSHIPSHERAQALMRQPAGLTPQPVKRLCDLLESRKDELSATTRQLAHDTLALLDARDDERTQRPVQTN